MNERRDLEVRLIAAFVDRSVTTTEIQNKLQ